MWICRPTRKTQVFETVVPDFTYLHLVEIRNPGMGTAATAPLETRSAAVHTSRLSWTFENWLDWWLEATQINFYSRRLMHRWCFSGAHRASHNNHNAHHIISYLITSYELIRCDNMWSTFDHVRSTLTYFKIASSYHISHHLKNNMTNSHNNISYHIIPVVPHKAVAEVSKIGNL